MHGKTRITEGILFTDFYELTMSQLYYRAGLHERMAQFDYFFRHYPDYGEHQAGYCINAGLSWLIEWMQQVRFGEEEITLLRTHTSKSGAPLFSDDFLQWLKKNGSFERLSLRAIPEGRAVHPHVPLVTVQGPLAMAQIFESALLNQLNYQILIATKACRIREVADGNLLIDFGMRRAQGLGANAGARAALIGGADFTSNTGISYSLGYPPKGTHAHSMVQAFLAMGKGELAAFRAYAELYPDDCLLLVDTINTLKSGIPNAITVFQELKRKGHVPVGIRLDSGDLAYLSIQAAKMLNEAGFDDSTIVLSNQLDELVIWQIISQIRSEAPRYGVDAEQLIRRLAYGVGTRLITSRGAAALDGIYKLSALKRQEDWVPVLKLSESPAKIINPGRKKVWRIYDNRGKAIADYLTLDDEDPRHEKELLLFHPQKPDISRMLSQNDISSIEPLLVDVIQEGKRVYDFPSLEAIRRLRQDDLQKLDSGIKRLINPHIYHISISRKLHELKQKLIERAQNADGDVKAAA